MISTVPHVISTSNQAWRLIEADYKLRLSRVAHGNAEEHQKAMNMLFAETRKRGNPAHLGPAWVEMEIADTNKRAEWSYQACCEVWEVQSRPKSRVFFRAVFDWCLQPIFATRESSFKHALELHQTRTRCTIPQGNSAILGHMKREMDHLRSDWNKRLEIDTRNNEYQRGAALDPNSTRATVGNGKRNEYRASKTNDRTLAGQWRELREQFASLANEEKSDVAPGLDSYIRAHVDDGEGIRGWMPTKRNTYISARFETIAARAGRLLGDAPEGRNSVDLWLESLFRDLLQQRKEGARVTNLLAADKPGEGGIIEQVCQESATFCARLETKADTDEARVVKLPSAVAQKAIRNPAGRKPTRNPEFVRLAGELWKTNQDSSRRVTLQALKLIAAALDELGFSNPSDWLEGIAARDLKAHNKKFGNSPKKILSWTDIVSRNEPDFRSAMRKLLSRCARISGN
jgi:hypothetical protein